MSSRSDDSLLVWAVRTAGRDSQYAAPRWSHVKRIVGLGQGSATKLCRRYNQDPEELVGGCWRCMERQSEHSRASDYAP
jgi:hypothetical protein